MVTKYEIHYRLSILLLCEDRFTSVKTWYACHLSTIINLSVVLSEADSLLWNLQCVEDF